MFPRGVSHYVDLMEELIPQMKDATVRTAIDTGCGVSHIMLLNTLLVRIFENLLT